MASCFAIQTVLFQYYFQLVFHTAIMTFMNFGLKQEDDIHSNPLKITQIDSVLS